MNYSDDPICLLIPRIIHIKYHSSQIFFRFLCSNNHTEILKCKNIKKICLNDKNCCECNDLNNKSEFYCKECFNIICNKCKKIHQETKNHKNIIDINIIDDNCFFHNEKNILYCNNCEESLCNLCIKSQNQKGHEICELKFLDLKKLEDNCNKLKKI